MICENIAALNDIAEKCRSRFESNGCKIYTYDRVYRRFAKYHLEPGDIVIATNIAGRGTDLEINDMVSTNGGLHVILSYMPTNVRVEKQAFGRAARAGSCGSGTYIVYDETAMFRKTWISLN